MATKRPGSPSSPSQQISRKRPITADDNEKAAESEGKTYVFKDPTFVHAAKEAAGNKKTRIWKNLKQITAEEKKLTWPEGSVCYSSIEAPPSKKPPKKYSDITGLEARYTDPHSKLHFSNAEEFTRLKTLPQEIIQGLLQLRKAQTLMP